MQMLRVLAKILITTPNCVAEWNTQTHSCEIKYRKHRAPLWHNFKCLIRDREMSDPKFTLKLCSSQGPGRNHQSTLYGKLLNTLHPSRTVKRTSLQKLRMRDFMGPHKSLPCSAEKPSLKSCTFKQPPFQ